MAPANLGPTDRLALTARAPRGIGPMGPAGTPIPCGFRDRRDRPARDGPDPGFEKHL